jgi:uncharacterized protein YegJ (DUF2314 family)
MWIDVVAFRGGKIVGNLDNDPEVVTSLKAGAHVEATFDDVGDYILMREDGSKVGGYSIDILMKRSTGSSR